MGRGGHGFIRHIMAWHGYLLFAFCFLNPTRQEDMCCNFQNFKELHTYLEGGKGGRTGSG